MKEVTANHVAHYKQNKELINELIDSVVIHHTNRMLKIRIAEILYKHIPTLDQACYERGCPCIDPFEEKK